MSFGELLDEANQMAHGLRAAGLQTGDVVAAILPNDPMFFVAQLATEQIGMHFLPVNWHLKENEISHILRDSGAGLVIAHHRFAESCVNGVDEAGIRLDRRLGVGKIDGFLPVEALFDGMPTTTPENRQLGALMMYTAGTTGMPKGVKRSIRNVDPSWTAHQGTRFAKAFQMRFGGGTNLVTGPLYHAGPLAFAGGSLNAGQTQVLMDKWSSEETLHLIEKYHVTTLYLVSTMFHRLLSLPESVRSKYDVSSLEMVVHSAAPTPVQLKRRMVEWFGPVIWETYGGTEGAATISSPRDWETKPGSVGKAVRGVDLRVIDEGGNPCPPGATGTVQIRTQRQFQYHNDAGATNDAYDGDGFFSLGDVGYLDEDGYLFLQDRKKDLIISGGVNIAPAEVEGVLLDHPAVEDVAVIGIPNEEWGEEVKAVVQLAPPFVASDQLAAELIAFTRESLAHFKCPRSVDFRSDLPRTDSGKLYKRRIREDYWPAEESVD